MARCDAQLLYNLLSILAAFDIFLYSVSTAQKNTHEKKRNHSGEVLNMARRGPSARLNKKSAFIFS